MKIYTKAVWQWQPDGSLKQVPEECESFDYEGPISLCGGGDMKTAEYMTNPIGADNQYGAKSRTPPQPDYIGAANAQSYGTIGASIANNLMSHPNVTTPLGSQTWTQNGNTPIDIPGLGTINIPQYSQNISLSPEQQSLYQGQTGLQQNLMGQAQNNLSDNSSVQGIADKAYSAMTSRLDPQWQHAQEMQQAQLANQGLVPGGEAYDNAMRDFNNAKNDAYQQAQLGAIQTMPIAMQARDLPLNELNALRTGSPVNMPQFQPTQYSMGAQGPQSLQAAQGMAGWQQAMYNSQVAQQNSMNQGLMGLGAAAMYAFA